MGLLHIIFLELVLTYYFIEGSDYYVAFPKNCIANTLKLFISAKQSNEVNIMVHTLEGFNFSGTVKYNQTLQIDVPSHFEVHDSTQRYKGIKIKSDNEVKVFGQSYHNKSSGVFSALPCVEQNVKEYTYYGVTYEDNTEEVSWLLVVGCENDTVIKINSEVVLLNEMETYQFSEHNDLTGVRIVSNKPISFFSGHECDVIPAGVYFCDHLIEQLPNTALWGKQFLTAPLFGRTAPDIYTIVYLHPSTNITMVCSNSTFLELSAPSSINHETVTVPGGAYCSIDSTHPVLVAQFASGQEADNTESDPFMMTIPPLELYGNDYVVVVPPQFPGSTIAVFVLPQYYEPDRIFVDGISQKEMHWTAIFCSNQIIVCGHVTFFNVTMGQHRVYHEEKYAKMAVSVYGFSYQNGYGYYDWKTEKTVPPKTTESYPTMLSSNGQTSLGGVVGGIVTPIIIVGVATAVALYFYFKRVEAKRRQHYQMDIFASGNAQPRKSAADEESALNSYSGQQQEVDEPFVTRTNWINSSYLRELMRGKFLIESEQLFQLQHIGQGEFGVVYRARLGRTGSFNNQVAVKTLKGNFNQPQVEMFAEESLKMSRFKHPHVMGLIGVCLDAGPAPYIVMPYMANGCLLDYLRRERDTLVFQESIKDEQVDAVQKRLMVMCNQIASGMEYLAAEKYVHRDLAARNCMIDSHFVIKISDFGLSEDVFQRNYYREGVDGEMAKLPVKWMAPESLSDGHFSEKSDVWSFGVTMWEIFSGGKSPYPGTNPVSLMQMLEEGDRMPKPYNAACSDEIYMMMLQCWESMPDKRPSFKTLYTDTSKLIEGIAGYLVIGFNPFTAGDTATAAGEEESN